MKTTLRMILFAAIMLLIAIPAFSQDLSYIPGAYADIGMGTRSLGMGGAYTAQATAEDGARWNPAKLATLRKPAVGFTWTKQFNLINYNYLAASYPMSNYGLGFYVETAGDEVLRENTIAIAGGMKLKDVKFFEKFNFLPEMPAGLSFGATAKIRMASYGNNDTDDPGQVQGDAFGYGLDIGIYYDLPMFREFNVALMYRDLINNISWDSNISGSYSEGVPSQIIIGMSYKPAGHVTATVDLKPRMYHEVQNRAHMGLEYVFRKIIAIRGGVAQDIGVIEPNRDLMLGIGVNTAIKKKYRVEAGFTYIFDELHNSPRAGLRFLF